ncbi:MAG: hypothetical protein U1D96_05410 [Eubacteriales bacterium]|nr:hypothetical protein [Clostridia bacterium]MDZ4042918.1 hypothetical protein [Eubacteriales bacterium]
MQYHLGIDPAEQGKLDDDQWAELAALAYFYEDRRAVAVQRGVLMALQDAFGK